MPIQIPVVTQDGESDLRTIKGKDVALTFEDGEEVIPPLVDKVDTDIEGKTTTVTEECGDSETRKQAPGNWSVAITGIITTDELAQFQAMGEGDFIDVDAVVLGDHSGEFVVKSVSITDSEDLTTVFVPAHDAGPRPAFDFRLDLKSPS